MFNLIVFINDLESYFDKEKNGLTLAGLNICHLLFADDLVLLSDSPVKLQELLNNLTNYCNDNKLTINIEKTNIVIFGTKTHYPIFRWTVTGQHINVVDKYNYLGVTFHKNSKFKHCVESLVKKGQRAYYVLSSNLFGDDLDPKVCCKIFKAIVEPVILYNSEVWGMDFVLLRHIDSFPPEKLQTKFCKRTLGVSPRTHNWACRAELGLFPLLFRVIKSIVQFYNHILHSSNIILKHAFNESVKIAKHKIGWYYKLSCLLDKFNIKESNLSSSSVLNDLQMKFTDMFHSSVQDKPNTLDSRNKLRTYRKFKSEIYFEPYLQYCKIKKHRIHFTKLRLSDHRLQIELGRRSRPPTPLEDRLCYQCSVLEDEEHYFMCCTKYANARKSLFNSLSSKINNFLILTASEKFSFLFKNSDPNSIEIICYYLYNFKQI